MNTFVVNGEKKRACSGTSARRRFPGRINHSNQKSIPISDERPRLQPEREMKHVFFFFFIYSTGAANVFPRHLARVFRAPG